jgi:hypothetical protein
VGAKTIGEYASVIIVCLRKFLMPIRLSELIVFDIGQKRIAEMKIYPKSDIRDRFQLVTRHCRQAASRSFTRSLVTSSIMCGPHFCSMKITEDVRKFATEQGIKEESAIQKGLKRKATEFTTSGSEIYAKA